MNKKLIALTLLAFLAEQGTAVASSSYVVSETYSNGDCCPAPRPTCCPKVRKMRKCCPRRVIKRSSCCPRVCRTNRTRRIFSGCRKKRNCCPKVRCCRPKAPCCAAPAPACEAPACVTETVVAPAPSTGCEVLPAPAEVIVEGGVQEARPVVEPEFEEETEEVEA